MFLQLFENCQLCTYRLFSISKTVQFQIIFLILQTLPLIWISKFLYVPVLPCRIVNYLFDGRIFLLSLFYVLCLAFYVFICSFLFKFVFNLVWLSLQKTHTIAHSLAAGTIYEIIFLSLNLIFRSEKLTYCLKNLAFWSKNFTFLVQKLNYLFKNFSQKT